jgi:Tol biopolymer transport system component
MTSNHKNRLSRSVLVFANSFIFLLALTSHAQDFSGWSAPENLGEAINTSALDGCPYISKDGLSLFFATNRSNTLLPTDIFVSRRESVNDPWGPPVDLGPTINLPSSEEFCPTLSIDGHFLYFVSSRTGGCGGNDLYVSHRQDKHDDIGWEPPVNLGCHPNGPNSAQSDITPSLFDDDNEITHLYFSSNRPGGLGGQDIYDSLRLADGSFSFASNVLELNTSFNDQRPNVRRRDGREIFFESNRPGTFGNLDLYVSTRPSNLDSWATPANLDAGLAVPIVNSTSVDGRASLSWDGTKLYFMSNRPGGFGDQDVYVTRRMKITGSN